MWHRSLVLIALFASPSPAIFLEPPNAPVDRLIRNVALRVRQNPSDARAHYTLGRIHYIAFSHQSTKLKYREGTDGLPVPLQGAEDWTAVFPPRIPEKAIAYHFISAMLHFRKARQLDTAGGLPDLALASLYSEARYWAQLMPFFQYRSPHEWSSDALEHYSEAFRLAADADVKQSQGPMPRLLNYVSLEAANAYLNLQPTGALAERMRRHIEEFKGLPPPPVTPLILTLRKDAVFATLLSPTSSGFDLDGSGRPQRWPWLAVDAALLVWDPERTGKITSGRELFGNVTWWMFWANGYEPLAALDDDQDGWLRGAELAGLGLWMDRNQNGVSEPGEVSSIEAAVIALRVSHDATEPDGSLRATRGAVLRDGSTVHTWDWIARRP